MNMLSSKSDDDVIVIAAEGGNSCTLVSRYTEQMISFEQCEL